MALSNNDYLIFRKRKMKEWMIKKQEEKVVKFLYEQ